MLQLVQFVMALAIAAYLQDGRSAVAHAPRSSKGQCTWAAAHALCAAALEAMQDWTQAALHMQQVRGGIDQFTRHTASQHAAEQ